MDDFELYSDKPHSKFWEKIIMLSRASNEYKRKQGRRTLRRKTNEKLRKLLKEDDGHN